MSVGLKRIVTTTESTLTSTGVCFAGLRLDCLALFAERAINDTFWH
jgi:hypothetical protein